MIDDVQDDNSLLDPNRPDPNTPVNDTETLDIPEAAESKEEIKEDVTPEIKDEELPLPDDTIDEKSKLPKWAEKRLSKKDREIAELKYKIDSVTANINTPIVMPQAEMPPPKREDFQNEEDFIDARIEYKNNINVMKAKAIEDQKNIAYHENNFRQKWSSAFEEGGTKYEDFEDRVAILNDRSFPPNRAMAEAIVDSDYKTDILYFLGTYPDEARKYANLNPIQAVKKIAALEARFAEKGKSKTVSKAPPPPVPIKGNKGMAGEGDPNKMDDQNDFEAWYKAKYGRR